MDKHLAGINKFRPRAGATKKRTEGTIFCMFTNLEQKLRRTAIVGVLALLAGLVMGCQESKQKTEIEIGPNTLQAKRELQTQRLDHRLQWSGNGVRRKKQPTMNDELIAGWHTDGVATDVPKRRAAASYEPARRVGPTSSAFYYLSLAAEFNGSNSCSHARL